MTFTTTPHYSVCANTRTQYEYVHVGENKILRHLNHKWPLSFLILQKIEYFLVVYLHEHAMNGVVVPTCTIVCVCARINIRRLVSKKVSKQGNK